MLTFIKKEHGFTFVEILFALAVIGIAFLAVSYAMQNSYAVTWKTQERAVAVNLAREQLELLKRFDNSKKDPVLEASVEKTVDGIKYKIETSKLSGSGIFNSSNVIPIRVKVSWKSRNQNFSFNIDTCYIKEY